MLCRKQHAEIGLNASKIIILMLKINNTIVSKLLKALGIIQKQENGMLYELKLRDVERRLFTCEQLLQRHRRKGLLHCIVT